MMARMPDVRVDGLADRFRALPTARRLLAALHGHGVYAVGGTVRDLLLEVAPVDIDLVIDGDVDALAQRLGGPVRAHGQFGTATVDLDGVRHDLAQARRESYARPGALPDVAPASIGDDLRRRDFTVNTLALGLAGPRAGELLQAPGALDDLTAGRLRVLHDASFYDDPTRLLRLARYSARLGFDADPRTRALADDAVSAGALDTISGGRVGTELRLLGDEPDPVAGYAALRALGLDGALRAGFGLADPEPARRALGLLPADGDRGAIVEAAALLGVDAGERRSLLDRLAFPAARRDRVLAAADRAPAIADALATARLPSQIAAAVAGAPDEAVALAGALRANAAAGARRWLNELRNVRPAIDGGDLVAAGVTPGPDVGAGLRAALAARLDGRARGRDAELAEALRAVSSSG
jgi:tRNA nucleotidyltransferase (CCA-adding enzyme)